MRVVVVEDEAGIASFVSQGLEAAGYLPVVATTGAEGLAEGLDPATALVVLDLGLPDIGGDEVLAALRRRRPDLPVIVLTASTGVPERVRLLDAGADDYVTKPFSFAELLARVRARLRPGQQPTASVLTVGDLTVDLTRRTATRGDVTVDLSAREFALLEVLARHPGQVLSQQQLLDRVWGYDFDPGSNVVEVYVAYLRRKLGADLVQTVRGAGYRLPA
ncbi:response regulator transcription factor [Kineosporia sp. A_224]|uniref:response regulator transcription factor n=1 Tax=Kineosporia sp. A_224 TaxID=1962180 RepID=UPI000B4BC61B|nr:response regulator transcription factor [Kineosporia sp. A_224]